MKDTVREHIRQALTAMGAEFPEQIEVEIPKDESHGDLASPVAMGLARVLKRAGAARVDVLTFARVAGDGEMAI